jgi:hypothetical protein
MPTYRYYINGFVSDRFMNFILHDFIDPANALFTEGQYPNIRRLERNTSETTFLVDIPIIPEYEAIEGDYSGYMLQFIQILNNRRDIFVLANNEAES